MLKMIKTYHFSYIPVGLRGVISKIQSLICVIGPLKGEKEKNENRFVKFCHASKLIFFVFNLNCVCFFDETISVVKREKINNKLSGAANLPLRLYLPL